ncbi:MAG: CDP-diacylglycerol--glycerol-3-phosphate 3-phosphatidyltransferase [Myxococcota bacterium]|jgi:CDP-diacylglycerol--glycerol-3-phosphate 3-phosphatidyltransferase
MKRSIKEEFFNIPNTITLLRIALIPLALVLLSRDTPAFCFWGTLIFAVASATDFLDGYIARNWNMITITGKFLDPLADKLIVISTLLVLLPMGRVPAWAVIIIVARELAITSLRAMAAGEGMVMAAGQEGKWKTALQLTGMVGLMVNYPYIINFGIFQTTFHFHQAGLLLLYASIFFSILSAGKYIVWFVGEADRRHQEFKKQKV